MKAFLGFALGAIYMHTHDAVIAGFAFAATVFVALLF